MRLPIDRLGEDISCRVGDAAEFRFFRDYKPVGTVFCHYNTWKQKPPAQAFSTSTGVESRREAGSKTDCRMALIHF